MGITSRFLITLLFTLLSTSVLASIGPMNYQGRLLDNNGVPVTGSYAFRVRIYDDPTAGTVQFQELHNSVPVNDGVYSFLVSTGVNESGTWDINLWNQAALYLEVEVNTEVMTPRQRIAAAPYAFQANLALTTNNALALGGKSASEYDNILQDICISSKGKWLSLIEFCLGIGADLTATTSGTWSSDDASGDYTNLDLSRANISTTLYNSASVDFSNTEFKDTTYNSLTLNSANLSNTVWDGAVDGSVAFTGMQGVNLTNATIKNMSLEHWDLSTATLTGLSAAELSACPAALPANWQCLEQFPSSGRWFLIGDGANLSAGSAITTAEDNRVVLNLDKEALYPLTIDLLNVSFDGVYTDLNFSAPPVVYSFDGVSFEHAVLDKVRFSYINMSNVSFDNAELHGVYILMDDFYSTNITFNNAKLSEVWLTCLERCYDYTFIGATIRNTRFGLGWEAYITNPWDFTDAIIENLYSAGIPATFNNTKIYGMYFSSPISGTTFVDTEFRGGNIAGNFNNMTFSTGMSIWSPVTMQRADFTGKDLSGWFVQYPNWFGATCPDGSQITTFGASCSLTP
jgi:uncharacterized protein YjbI with pentapeptide repeats